jgi:hypothetical protein
MRAGLYTGLAVGVALTFIVAAAAAGLAGPALPDTPRVTPQTLVDGHYPDEPSSAPLPGAGTRGGLLPCVDGFVYSPARRR